MAAATGEQAAVLLLRTSWTALRNDGLNDLALANALLDELNLEQLRDAVALLTRAVIVAAEQPADLDVDEFLAALGMSAAVAAVAS